MKLSYVICPGSNPNNNQIDLYNKIYDCWKLVWENTYKELGLSHKLFSDAFTRQTEIGAIFVDEVCLAMCFFRQVNSSLNHFTDDSYFSCWSDLNIQKLKSFGSKTIVSSHFTIHPNARKGQLPFSMKDILTGISVEYFFNSNQDVMAANLRVDRKVNESCKKWGAELIEAQVKSANGEPGDLMCFHSKSRQVSENNEMHQFVKNLWKERINIKPKDNLIHFKHDLDAA